MPVPKRKRSRARRDKRFANKGLKMVAVAHCQQCRYPLKPHQACYECGYYKGVKVMVTKAERGHKRSEQNTKQPQKQVVDVGESGAGK
jgi:large subunit ribosomal protein L32